MCYEQKKNTNSTTYRKHGIQPDTLDHARPFLLIIHQHKRGKKHDLHSNFTVISKQK